MNEVACRTNDQVGDGTTTASVLAKDLTEEGLQAICAGRNPVNIKSGLDKTCHYLIRELQRRSNAIRTECIVASVATLSAGNDPSVGKLISSALDRVGSDGVLSVEISRSFETVVDVQEGMDIDRGYISPHFVTSAEKGVAEHENCRILVCDDILADVKTLIVVMELIAKDNHALLIIAEDVTGEALSTLLVNKLRGNLQVVAVKAPGFGERRKALLQDIAIVSSAVYFSKEVGLNVSQALKKQLGLVRKVKVCAKKCSIIAGKSDRSEVLMRVSQLKADLSDCTSVYDTEKLSERIAKLTGGIAIIKVGGFTDTELQENTLRVEDAKNATFAAIEEGIIPGGGTAFVHLSELKNVYDSTGCCEVERLVFTLLQQALFSPTRLIASASGNEAELIVEAVIGQLFRIGFNVTEKIIADLMQSGIIDPAKVTRSGLQNSSSIAGLLLTTQAIVYSLPTKSNRASISDDNYGLNNTGIPVRLYL